MVLKSRAHPLPKFPDAVIPTFERLCVDVPTEEIPGLLSDFIEKSKKQIEDAMQNPLVDVKLLQDIHNRCEQLLTVYEAVPQSSRKLIIGAVRYCITSDDGMSEKTFATGLHDDARIVNYVLEELGIEDAFIQV